MRGAGQGKLSDNAYRLSRDHKLEAAETVEASKSAPPLARSRSLAERTEQIDSGWVKGELKLRKIIVVSNILCMNSHKC